MHRTSHGTMVYLRLAALLVLQAAFIYAPFMNTMFRSAPLNTADLGKSVLVALSVLPVISIEKALRGRTPAAVDAGAGSV